MTAASLDALPTEILDQILADCKFPDIVSLWKCNKTLSHRLELRLFGSREALRNTMRWACVNGDVAVIRTAISCGADSSIVEVPKRPQDRLASGTPAFPPAWATRRILLSLENGPYSASTLAMAARRGHLQAFVTLIELGAGVSGVHWNQIKALIQTLRRRDRWDLLRCFLDAGLGRQVMDHASLDLSLAVLIKRFAPIDIVKSMIRQGASPNHLVYDGHGNLISPLSAAIQRGNIAIADLLLEAGADIQGTTKCLGFYKEHDRPFIYHRPRHVPIFAAAEHMARIASTDMMDWCLRNGASIHATAPAMRFHVRYGTHFATSPLITYLEDLYGWSRESEVSPRLGVMYFLDRGGQWNPQEHSQQRRWAWLEGKRSNGSSVPKPIEFLLEKWPPSQLKEPQFFETIKCLVQHRLSMQDSYNLLRQFSVDRSIQRWRRFTYLADQDRPINVPQWWEIVHLVLDQLQKDKDNYRWLQHIELPGGTRSLLDRGILNQRDQDELLYSIFMSKMYWPDPDDKFDQIICDRIQGCGADINFRFGGNGETVLHYYCRLLNGILLGKTKFLGLDEEVKRRVDKAKVFCVALVNRGADPFLEGGGQTPIDILKKGLENVELARMNDVVEMESRLCQARQEFIENQLRHLSIG